MIFSKVKTQQYFSAIGLVYDEILIKSKSINDNGKIQYAIGVYHFVIHV